MNRADSKNGLSRNLKYGFVFGEKVFLMLIFMSVIYAGVIYIQGSTLNKNILLVTFQYFMILSVIMVFIMQFINKTQYISISVSFGMTRKNTFIGTQSMNLLWILQSYIIFSLFILLMNEDFHGWVPFMRFVYLIILLLACGIGSIISVISSKFGKLIALVVSSVIVIILITTFVLTFVQGDMVNVRDSITTVWMALFVAIAGLIYILGSYLFYHTLENYEIRA